MKRPRRGGKQGIPHLLSRTVRRRGGSATRPCPCSRGRTGTWSGCWSWRRRSRSSWAATSTSAAATPSWPGWRSSSMQSTASSRWHFQTKRLFCFVALSPAALIPDAPFLLVCLWSGQVPKLQVDEVYRTAGRAGGPGRQRQRVLYVRLPQAWFVNFAAAEPPLFCTIILLFIVLIRSA